ncbi:glycosyltransferase family protein [Tellurirhabdus rosea]|uniref:glycosyl transferase n=1 Tax=Tellurirhabdus rosea TaxID=2674997 RepID=UPI00225B1B5F|nr:glycosyl transferase [Tellurirhabdus rosea]
MTLAFTLCSINYLAQARTLGDSLRQTNPDWQFVIGLVDRLAEANLPEELVPAYPMIEVDRIEIEDFAGMCDRYDITELNTAVKPYYMDYLFRHHPDATEVIYFDPDIIVYQPLTRLSASLAEANLVLTPHTCSPINDWLAPNELNHLNTGIFNLGFIGLRRSEETLRFVDWWKKRLAYECRIDLCNGLFVDQHWVNFAPVYFDRVQVERHPGYNVAYWNLHERTISRDGDRWLVNESELQFFHFSGYSPYKPEEISKYQNRFTFNDRPDIVALFQDYGNRLMTNRNDVYRTYPCHYIKPPKTLYYQRVRQALKNPLNQLIAALEK